MALVLACIYGFLRVGAERVKQFPSWTLSGLPPCWQKIFNFDIVHLTQCPTCLSCLSYPDLDNVQVGQCVYCLSCLSYSDVDNVQVVWVTLAQRMSELPLTQTMSEIPWLIGQCLSWRFFAGGGYPDNVWVGQCPSWTMCQLKIFLLARGVANPDNVRVRQCPSWQISELKIFFASRGLTRTMSESDNVWVTQTNLQLFQPITPSKIFFRPFEPSSEVFMHLMECTWVQCTHPSNTPTCTLQLLSNKTKVTHLSSCALTIFLYYDTSKWSQFSFDHAVCKSYSCCYATSEFHKLGTNAEQITCFITNCSNFNTEITFKHF